MHTTTSDVFLALGQPTRLSIIDLLAEQGELTATQISSGFGSSASAISQHLKVLREAGLVGMDKRAQHRVYQLDVGTLSEAESWIASRTRMWHARLDRLDAYLQRISE